MQTSNHSVISELLKSINAAAELCKTKLPDHINVTRNSQASADESHMPRSPANLQDENDSHNQDPKLELTKTLQNSDLSETVHRIHRKRRTVQLDSSDDELDQDPSSKFMLTQAPSKLECIRPDTKLGTQLRIQSYVTLPDPARTLASHITPARIEPSMKKQRCMDCNDCHRYSFAQQHGPHAHLPDGTKPMIRQCAAWQRYDRWRKRDENTLEYTVWRSAVDLHGPRYSADKDIRDQAIQFVALSNIEKAKGWCDETN